MPTDQTSLPLVSVLVPLYNHAAFVQECLDSIRDEDWPRLELLVLNDGSKDDSLAVAQAWVAKHGARFERVWLETQSNQGICKTVNRMIAAARGEYMALVASDDTLIRGGIRLRWQHLQQNPKHLAVFGTMEFLGDGTYSLEPIEAAHREGVRAWGRPELLARSLLLNWGVSGPVFFCRRQAYASEADGGVGPYDETLAHEDLDMYLRLLSRQALGFVDAPVGKYRTRGVYVSTLPNDEHYRVWAKQLHRFTGVNRWLVRFQMWKSERGFYGRTTVRSWIGKQAVSSWRKCHRRQLARL